jgi:hypothetical protein
MMPFLAMIPMMGQMPSFADSPVLFSAMRLQPSRWWAKQHKSKPNTSPWRTLDGPNFERVFSADLKRRRKSIARLREMGRSL